MGKANNIWSYLARHKYIITIILGTVLVGVVDECSVLKYITLCMRYNEVQEEQRGYEEAYRTDSTKLQAFEANRKGVERVARERYFMKRPNEDIFVLTTDVQDYERAN